MAIRTAVIKFEQECLGRGPDVVRICIVRDLIVVRLMEDADPRRAPTRQNS